MDERTAWRAACTGRSVTYWGERWASIFQWLAAPAFAVGAPKTGIARAAAQPRLGRLVVVGSRRPDLLRHAYRSLGTDRVMIPELAHADLRGVQELTIISHAQGIGTGGMRFPSIPGRMLVGNTYLTGQQAASLIARHGFRGGLINCHVCSAASTGFAHDLAMGTRTAVEAPYGLTRIISPSRNSVKWGHTPPRITYGDFMWEMIMP